MSLRNRAARRERGQSLAEFALVAPIFFLILFFVIQVGLVLAAQNGLVNGVRNSARRAATYRLNDQSFEPSIWGSVATPGSICATIAAELDAQLAAGRTGIPGFKVANLDRTISYEWQQNPESGEYFLVVNVSATYRNPLYVPLVSFFLDAADGTIDGGLRLSAREQMRVENPVLEPNPLPAVPPC